MHILMSLANKLPCILNVCNDLGAFCAHGGETGTVDRVCTRVDSDELKNDP